MHACMHVCVCVAAIKLANLRAAATSLAGATAGVGARCRQHLQESYGAGEEGESRREPEIGRRGTWAEGEAICWAMVDCWAIC